MLNKIFLLIVFCFCTKTIQAQVEIYAQTRGGAYISYATLLANKGKPSPYFKIEPLIPNTTIYSLYVEARYKKMLLEVGYELISIGLAGTESTELYFCKECEYPGSRPIEYSVPMEVFPIRIGYVLFNDKDFDFSGKVGYFQTYRKRGFMNKVTFGPHETTELIISQTDGIPFTKYSRNVQIGADFAWKFGKKRRSAITLGALYNHGLKVLGEDTYIFYRPNKPEESFENHVIRRGSFSGFVIGYRFKMF
jgi:hypothetical protein